MKPISWMKRVTPLIKASRILKYSSGLFFLFALVFTNATAAMSNPNYRPIFSQFGSSPYFGSTAGTSRTGSSSFLGTATLSPNIAPANSRRQFTVEYTVETPIQTGGSIQVYFGSNWDQIGHCFMTTDPSAMCGYIEVSSDNASVGLDLSVSHSDPNIAVRLAQATVTVNSGSLNTGDVVTIIYGANAGLAYVQEISHYAEVTVLVSTSLGESYTEIEQSPVLTVLPLSPFKLISAVKPTLRELHLSVVDQYGNHVYGYTGTLDIFILDEFGNEFRIGSTSVQGGNGFFTIPSTIPTGYYQIRSVLSAEGLESKVPFTPGKKSVFFGDIHFHTKLSDARYAFDILGSYEYAETTALLDFLSSADHAECLVHDNLFSRYLMRDILVDSWVEIQRINEVYNSDGFVTLNGFEVTMNNTSRPRSGHMNVYYRSSGNIYTYGEHNPKVEYVENPEDLWAFLQRDRADALTIPHHTLAPDELGSDLHYYDPHYMRVAEIYSLHGCSESEDCENTLFDPVADPDASGSIRRAIGPLNYRLGFVAASDSHAGHPAGTGIPDGYKGLTGGLTAVISPALDREILWNKIYDRRTYATTGERIYLEFRINKRPMGSEITSSRRLRIKARAIGTDSIENVQLFKYNSTDGWQAIYSSAPNSGFWKDSLIDFHFSENSVYYLKVTQADGHVAWSSPIWVDYEAANTDLHYDIDDTSDNEDALPAVTSDEYAAETDYNSGLRQLGYF